MRQLSSKIKGKAQFDTRDGLITVDDKYHVQKCVGTGAYGHVFSARDTLKNKKVAIKWIHKAFQDAIDAKRVLREIKILSKYPTSDAMWQSSLSTKILLSC